MYLEGLLSKSVPLRLSLAGVTIGLAAALAAPPTASAQLVTKLEAKCSAKLGKLAAKLAGTAAKELSKCREGDISGKAPQSCPSADNTAKINAVKAKIAKVAAIVCGSVCSVHQDVACLSDNSCPPLATGAHELCTAGASFLPFDMGNIGFPGPFCESLLGHTINSTDDLAQCVADLTEATVIDDLIPALYGSLSSTSQISQDAAKCLTVASKMTQKLVRTIHKGVVKCRSSINKGKTTGNPATCTKDDVKLAGKITKFEGKLRSGLAAKCTNAQVQELELCGSAAPLTVDDAADCLIAAALEVADTTTPANLRTYSNLSLVEAAYPPTRGVCGDGIVNQLPNPFLLTGEECDGSDDSACPGQCLPPGDLFECSCANIKRARNIADGITADLDNGWTGTSHNQGVADGSAHIFELLNCDCTALSPNGITCTGTSTDPVCDIVSHYQLPTCSWEPFGGTRCDDRATKGPAQGGSANGSDENDDCYICDTQTANPGDYCVDENDCQSQCYDATGNVTGPCTTQDNCAAGEVCRGLCDKSQSCVIIPNGAPLPLSSGGTAVCIVTDFRTDVTGSKNIITGEGENYQRLYSKLHLGVNNSMPCPMCGGFCDDSGKICQGTCSLTTSTACRFDADCPSGETCTTVSDTCPGSFCNLSLVCIGGPDDGEACRIEAATRDFGTTSHDCLPPASANISGQGLEINYLPQTTETVSLVDAVPCTQSGFTLFDCPCPDDNGRKTQPNNCAAACNAGPELAQGCGTGNSPNGLFTTCAAGTNAGFACDEDLDCPGSSCSANPTHCIGDPSTELNGCATNADCGLGTCVDACPSGRCVPLCVASGSDPEDGICAAGPPRYHCNGEHLDYISCFVGQAEGSCSATCSGTNAPCTSIRDCPSGETCDGTCDLARLCEAGNDGILGTVDDNVGAGICVVDTRNCFLPGIHAEGGDIFNGKGDPDNAYSVSTFCIGATGDNAINTTAGIGGPGRIRSRSLNVSNGFTSLP